MHHAAHEGLTDIVKSLINIGADINIITEVINILKMNMFYF